MEPITAVTWRWTPPPGYRSTFGPETVNTLKRMLRRHCPAITRMVCVTDDPAGIDSDIEAIPLWPDYLEVPSPHGATRPSCYRRLRAFAPDIASVFGPRFVMLDLDCVITGDLTPLLDRPEDFVAWNGTHRQNHYNGSMMLLRAGTRPQVWADFDPARSPREAHEAGFYGSDQAWISHRLGPGEATWTKADGVYSYRNDLRRFSNYLPPDARIVFFHGRVDPWADAALHLDWVRRCYQ